MEQALQIKNLSVTLNGKANVLKNLSLDLPKGKIIGLIGPSGSGKTTLMRCIVGLTKPTEGSISIFGAAAGSAKLRRQITYMTQSSSIYPDLTVLENVQYFASMAGTKRAHRKVVCQKILEAVSLTNKASVLVGDLSGGEKQRVSLAIALIGNPKLMVLDEPTVGLDPVLRVQLWNIFDHLAGTGTTLIISSHAMDEASRCQDIVLLRDGVLLAHKSPRQLCLRTGTKTVEKAFIEMVRLKK